LREVAVRRTSSSYAFRPSGSPRSLAGTTHILSFRLERVWPKDAQRLPIAAK
jgi:hypothetical protein